MGTLAFVDPLEGRRVAITGAAGGVGRFAVQLGHALHADVTAVVGSPERGEGLPELGADHVVSALEPEGEPFDLILGVRRRLEPRVGARPRVAGRDRRDVGELVEQSRRRSTHARSIAAAAPR